MTWRTLLAPAPRGADAPLLDDSGGPAGAPLFMAALLYLLLPATLVLLYFAPWPLAVAVAAALAVRWAGGAGLAGAGAGAGAATAAFAAPRWPAVRASWPYLVLAAAVALLAGTLPPFAENLDWYKHYAIFNTLQQQAWPPLSVDADGVATLRYYLGYYVVPALAGKALGAAALPLANFIWTTLGLYLALVLAFGPRPRPVAGAFLLGCVLLLFSGADIVGTKLTGGGLGPVMHFEWWWPLGAICAILTNLFWAPQHTVPALLAAFLLLRCPRRGLAQAGVLGAATALWSPFAAFGLVPLLLWAAVRCGPRALLSRANLLAAPVLLLAAARFLGEGTAGIPADLIWEFNDFTLPGWLLFLLLEFGAIAAALLLVAPRTALPVGLCALFLSLLALFRVGGGSDLLMRASIPALGVLALLAATAIATAPNTVRKAPLVLCLVAGLATPLGEIMRSLIAPRIANARHIGLADVIQGNPDYARQYLVYRAADNVVHGASVVELATLHFQPYGQARFDLARHRVASDVATDAGLVSDLITLPAGVYKLEAQLDWQVASGAPGKNGAQLSLYGERMLLPIMPSSARAQPFQSYLRSDGKPFRLAFGLGGWSTGSGYVELTQLKLGLVKRLAR